MAITMKIIVNLIAFASDLVTLRKPPPFSL